MKPTGSTCSMLSQLQMFCKGESDTDHSFRFLNKSGLGREIPQLSKVSKWGFRAGPGLADQVWPA